jgi:hypothetical protein
MMTKGDTRQALGVNGQQRTILDTIDLCLALVLASRNVENVRVGAAG